MYYLDFSRLTGFFANYGATIGDYIGHGWMAFYSIVTFLIASAMIVTDILVWTIPTKEKKKALKNINGDKRLYRKIWWKSGCSIVFCIMSTCAIFHYITNYLLDIIVPFSAFSLPGDSLYIETVKFYEVTSIILGQVIPIIYFIVAIALKSKADKSALNKSTHSKVVRKIKENKYRK